MHLGADGPAHRQFGDLPGLLAPGNLLVVNDTRVINARLHGVKDTGGSVELLVERIEADRVALCQARSSKPLRPGRTVNVSGWRLGVVEREGEFFRLEFPVPVSGFLERFGETPLPPYIERAPERCDSRRYQTSMRPAPAQWPHPTAGLHFSEGLFKRLAERGVEVSTITLHVGAGTFQARSHRGYRPAPHARRALRDFGRNRGERTRVQAGGRPSGSCRDDGGACTGDRGCHTGWHRGRLGETRLFITPGYRFLAADALLTNFHLPESTLLMLVCAFAGYDRVMSAYAEAVAAGYRFFSYGDAMFCERGRECLEVLAQHGQARRGRLTTPHGTVETPVFMPCGHLRHGQGHGAPRRSGRSARQILLGNTFHLMLRPGDTLIRNLGGLHAFMGWQARYSPTAAASRCGAWVTCASWTREGVEFRSPVMAMWFA